MDNKFGCLLKKVFALFVFIQFLLSCDDQYDNKKCDSIETKPRNTISNISSYSCGYDSKTNQIKRNTDVDESIKKEIRQLIVATNKTLIDARMATSDVLKKISQIPDTQRAFKLYDLLLDLSIAQQVTIKDYNKRQNWYATLWYNVMGAFVGAQHKLGNDLKYYEKIFQFFAKYTDEILEVEKTLPVTDCQYWSLSEVRKGEFLYGIKGELKTWIHVMRDLYAPELTRGFTKEQKDNLLRRFNELEKFTDIPINHPGGTNLSKRKSPSNNRKTRKYN